MRLKWTLKKKIKIIFSIQHLKLISCISDEEYQIRVWIKGIGPECHDFDEAVNEFFPTCESILENYNDFKLTAKQYKVLKLFQDEFQIFADKNDFPEEFLDTPGWGRIMNLAKDVLKAFNYYKS